MKGRLPSNDQSCLDVALRYLSYRPRSEWEVRRHLEKKGFGPEPVQAVLRSLREQKLVDDVAFAEFWKTNRESFSPRSRAMLRSELRRKGITQDIIAEVVQGVDEEASAWEAAQKRARRFTMSDYDSFSRGLTAFLRQRGFNHELAQQTANYLWKERHEENV
ncbi:MAG: regulatory protein RecX [Chloroflexi bacterium]|nr:regulatory protein RecX [Chloroflexota bacterium]